MNWKSKGEKGQRIAIGELAKWDVDIAVPLSDNLPWDFICIYDNKLFRAQVKSSEKTNPQSSGCIEFGLTTNNWHRKTTKKYTADDCDIMILCDYNHIYLLSPAEFSDRRSFTIRQHPSKNKQSKGVHLHDDFVISKKRIKKVLK